VGQHGCSAGAWGRALIVSDKAKVGPWVAKKLFAKWSPEGAEAIGLERSGEMVAGVIYENWNGKSCVCHVAVQGLLTPKYLAAIFHFPFVFGGLEKIIAPVAESNAESIRFVSKLGFREEARLLEAHPDGSVLLFTMNRDQCRFIGERFGKRLLTAARA
jgi:RimJ/RimL family protein N-acetyltransferase